MRSRRAGPSTGATMARRERAAHDPPARWAPCALLASGCGETKQAAAAAPAAVPKPTCAYPAGWQKLANKIKAPVYCPGWLPDPLTSQIDGRWSNINSVSPDRSYLESFVWQETGGGAARRRAARQPARLPGPDGDPDLPHGRRPTAERPVLRRDPRADGHRERHHRAALPGRTRTWTRGTRCCSGARAARCTRSPSTSPRRSRSTTSCGYLKRELASLVARPPSLMKLTRRQFIVGTAAGAVGAAGIYELVDQFTGGSPERAAAAQAARAASARRRARRRLGRGRGARAAAAPPDPDRARRRRPRATCALRRRELERLLAELDADYAPSPAGLGVTVAWGLPYFGQLRAATLRSACCRTTDARASRCSDRRGALPERSRSTRGSSRTTSRSCCAPTTRDHIEDAEQAHPRHEALPGDVDPARLRRRRLRRRPVAAEADGAAPRRSRAPT